MPHFYFHVHNSIEVEDEVGVEHANLDAAVTSGIIDARHLMSDEIKSVGRICLSHYIEICDASGIQMHIVRYGDCVEILP
uniref:DUF6894 family protein n=1 Tax=Sphingomonas nostoxanthinifaciens TaxID=2872652 RepID=UPI0037DA03AB